MPFAPIADVIAAIGRGELVVLVDDEDRENEGDLVMAAEFTDEQRVAFMACEGRGLICLPMAGELIDRLGLPMMTADNRAAFGTAFTVSIEAAAGVTTGISAADRATTIRIAVADGAGPGDLVVPGHVFPLRAAAGGTLVRAGQTEGAVDLARLAGCRPAGVICEIMQADGRMARLPELKGFCARHDLLLASIADLIAYREKHEDVVDLVERRAVPTGTGLFRACIYRDRLHGGEYPALVLGDDIDDGARANDDPILVRVHRQDLLTDLFACDGALERSLERIAAAGRGVLLYLPRATCVSGDAPDQRRQTDAAGALAPRAYGIGAQILRRLGLRRLRLLASHDVQPRALSGHGLEIVERVEL